jgi:Zn-dependent peptidase ImmA (M78 family)
MASKSLLERGFKAKAERLSESFRSELGISKFAPLDAFDLAKHLKIQVLSVLELKDDLKPKDYARLSDPSKFSAMWMPNSDDEKIIIHNNFHSKKRQQSNLMHELAHVILGHEIPEEQAKLCFLLGLHYYNPVHEEEAKYFGGCLQITRPGLLWAVKKGDSEAEMSDYYVASSEMVSYRLRITGVLRQRSDN